MKLEFDEAGDGPAVVLIHGHPFNRSMWAPQLHELPGRVIAPDLRGYGDSPLTPGTVQMRELAADIWETLDVERVAVVGMSMGGLIAMEMVHARPERVSALGLVATTAQPVTDAERAERRALADEVERVGMGPLVEYMAPPLFGPDAPPDVVASVHAMMERNRPAGAAAAMRGRVQRPDYRPILRAVDVPVFVCVGDHDTWSTAEVTAELVGCLREPEVLVLEGVGHMPNLERPEAFNAALSAFLGRIGA
ncbi:alpha/beta fold hydrolase [Solirubrobacter soli]|uniref:alpha/beta fold hydrolase n=1 Tax=Solirubrobacter soli TaxID=363832 RepID=UPI0003FB968E|nr:alpha/beta hydrolase [Solirubrobacter soli]